MHYRQVFFETVFSYANGKHTHTHTRLQRLNKKPEHSPQNPNEVNDTIKDTIVIPSTVTLKNRQCGFAGITQCSLGPPRDCGDSCRGWASLDMSFKTPMLSRCSIFIHLQASNRPSGQHIVSLAVSSAVDATYVADRANMKPPASHPALFLAASPPSSPLCLTLPLDVRRVTVHIFLSSRPLSGSLRYLWVCYL